ncbi:MAG TPA: CobD/CbiB family protein [Burkholderiales bacterium]|nr:CobD/CbiB family protein [Burkholderiales bacterium]
MKFLSLLAALLLEQARPLRQGNAVHAAFIRYAETLERQLNAGQHYHGVIAWMLAVLPFVAVTVVVYHLLQAMNPILAWAWNIAVLYLTMGFRQFSHYFREIAQGLKEGDIAKAREYLARWRGEPTGDLTPSEVTRLALEAALVGSHRHVFGPIAWFLVLGPAGAVIYRLSAMLVEVWRGRGDTDAEDFGRFAQRFFFWYDWAPARLTAASFAIVGNFEDAVYCWRTQTASWTAGADGVLVASGAGALGVRLGDTVRQGGTIKFRPELGTGDEADVDYMASATGLIWRALVLWLFLIFIVTVAHSLGS